MMDFYKRMKANAALVKKHKTVFEVLEGYEETPKRKLKLPKASKTQLEAFLKKWRLKKEREESQQPLLVIASVLIAGFFIFGLIKLIEIVFLT